MEVLHQLKALGVRIALDDFGTGTPSLDMMHRFSFDRMKIDGRFVARLPGDTRGYAIVSALIRLAHDLGAKVTAEGVEGVEQALCLMSLGCDMAQGYFFAKPMPKERFVETMQARARGASMANPAPGMPPVARKA